MSALLEKKQLQPSLFFNNAETSHVDFIYLGNLLTDVITWTDNLKTQKIQEENLSYTANRVSTIITKQYDRLGVLVETLTENFTYAGNNIDFTDRVLT